MKTIQLRYGIDTLSRSVDDNATVGDLIKSSANKAGLGYSDNVRAMINGVQVPMEAMVPSGSTIVIETAANSKAQDSKSITLRYGIDSASRAVPYNATVGDVVKNATNKAALGYGDNIRALINGVPVPMEALAPNGCTITVETAANSKAILG